MKKNTKSFGPLKKPRRAFEEIALTIKESIFKGILKSGDRLPSETELANQFNVNRHTIREALRVLELSGFISIETGVSGGIVKNNIDIAISNLYLDALQMEDITADEFTAARMSIEKIILNDAIDNAEDEDIKNLQENLAKAKDLIAKKKVATSMNFEFHSLLAKASKNKVFIILEKTINTIMFDLRSRSVLDFKTTKAAVQVHEKLLDAIIRRDRKKAISLMEKHVLAVGKSLKPKSNN